MVPLLLLAVAQQASRPTPSIPWQTDFEVARKLAVARKLPIMIYFTTDWCGYCKIMERESFGAAEVVGQSAKYVPLKLDAEKTGVAQAKALKVNAFPTFVFLDPQKREVGRILGYKSTPDFVRAVDTVLAGDAPKIRLQKALLANPSNGKAAADLGMIFASENNLSEAETLAEQAGKAGYKGKPMAQLYSLIGRGSQRTNYTKCRETLQKAIDLRDPSVVDEAYEAMMISTIFANRREDMAQIAQAIVKDPLAGEALKAKAERTLVFDQYRSQLSSEASFLDLFLAQANFQPNRNPSVWKILFDSSATVTSLSSGPSGTMFFPLSSETWHKDMAVDRNRWVLTETSRKVETRGLVSLATIEYSGKMTLQDGKESALKGRFSLMLINNSGTWMIKSLLHEPIKT